MTGEINGKNAESIGRTIVEDLIRLLSLPDKAQFFELYPNLMMVDFEEAVNKVRSLGNALSVDYVGRLVKPQWHLLIWKVQSKTTGKVLLLMLGLSEDENKGAIRLVVKAILNQDEGVSAAVKPLPTNGQIYEQNAEALSGPIIEKLLKSLLNSDFGLYCQILTDPGHKKSTETLDIFNEAVSVLEPMGNLVSMNFLAHEKMTQAHLLMWNVRYEKEDEDLLFELMLTDDNGDIAVMGWMFDK